MRVVAINGSATKNGNTFCLIQEVLKPLEAVGIETEQIQLFDKNVEPCKACFTCGEKKNCSHKKDDFAEIFEKVKSADGIILGSPVYSANVSSKMQAFLERAAVVCDMNAGLLTHKAGAVVAAARRGGALNAIDTMTHFFLNHEMFVIGSTYWNMAYGQLPNDVINDGEGIANMKNLGENMAYLLKRI